MFVKGHLYLGGDLELEVPILVKVKFHKGHKGCMWGDYPEPPEPDWYEAIDVHRTDGLEWHDGCQIAFDIWWEEAGQYVAGEQDRDESEYAKELRAEMLREMALEDRRMES